MAASFTLELDTEAPRVTFGYFEQPEYGQDWIIPVSVNEPGIISAEIIDKDGVHHPLLVGQNALRTYVDNRVALGPAVLRVEVEDDVLNRATRERAVGVTTLYVVNQRDRAAILAFAADSSEDEVAVDDRGDPIMVSTDSAVYGMLVRDRQGLAIVGGDRSAMHTRVVDSPDVR